jgi:hypothetical protein
MVGMTPNEVDTGNDDNPSDGRLGCMTNPSVPPSSDTNDKEEYLPNDKVEACNYSQEPIQDGKINSNAPFQHQVSNEEEVNKAAANLQQQPVATQLQSETDYLKQVSLLDAAALSGGSDVETDDADHIRKASMNLMSQEAHDDTTKKLSEEAPLTFPQKVNYFRSSNDFRLSVECQTIIFLTYISFDLFIIQIHFVTFAIGFPKYCRRWWKFYQILHIPT